MARLTRIHLPLAAHRYSNHATSLMLLKLRSRDQYLSGIAFEDCCHSFEGTPLEGPTFPAVAQLFGGPKSLMLVQFFVGTFSAADSDTDRHERSDKIPPHTGSRRDVSSEFYLFGCCSGVCDDGVYFTELGFESYSEIATNTKNGTKQRVNQQSLRRNTYEITLYFSISKTTGTWYR